MKYFIEVGKALIPYIKFLGFLDSILYDLKLLYGITAI